MRLGSVPYRPLDTYSHMYSPDFAAYKYAIPKALADVFTIGWLSSSHAFVTGMVGQETACAIAELLWTNRVNETRGFHLCDLCKAEKPIEVAHDRDSVVLGSAEIWLPSPDESIVFATPDLIVHYVLAHNYRPPSAFLEAVAASGKHPAWKASVECERRLQRVFAC